MHWPMVPLGSLAEVVGGSTPSRQVPEFWGGSIPWATPTDLPMPGTEIASLRQTSECITEQGLESSAANLLPVGAVLFSSRATIGKLAIAEVPVATNQGFANFICGPCIYNRYLAWALLHFTSAIERLAGSTTFKEVTKTALKAFRIPLPPVSEQHRIVELLDEANRLRKLRREADAKAAGILPALFLRMFGDPATNPKGWPVDRLDRLFDMFGGGTPSKDEPAFWSGEIPWVSPKDMKRDVILDAEDHITAEAIANSATRLVTKGSVLIVFRSGILAHTFPVAIAGRDVALNQDLKALNSRGELLNEYLYGWLTTGSRLALSCVKKGATVHNVDGARFLALKVAKPPRAIQENFAGRLSVFLNLKKRAGETSQRVESLFNGLLQRAFSGGLTKNWRDAHMRILVTEIEQQAKLLNFSLAGERLTARA
jgi:type I restriction enzyme S subunit